MNKLLVVNLYGVPSAGKSTGASFVFSMLKMCGVNAELVTEFAKDKVWENNEEVFRNQAYIFGKQLFKITRCEEKVEVIVTDSPIMLSAFYNKDMPKCFEETVKEIATRYNSVDFLLDRVKPYNPVGRHQTEEESDALLPRMIDMLDKFGVNVKVADGWVNGYDAIVEEVLTRLDPSNERKLREKYLQILEDISNVFKEKIK